MTTFEYEPTGDVQLDNLLQEVQDTIQGNNDFLLPDEMVTDAINRACDFFDLPQAPILGDTEVCVFPQNPDTVFDDVFGFSREQLMNMGISGEDSLTLVYTHECAHRVLQDNSELNGKEKELACDFFAGVHAGMEGMDAGQLIDALGQTVESDSHPDGELRADIITYGQDVAEEMMAQGIPITFENCMERLEGYLNEHPVLDTQETAFTSSFGLTHGENISFGAGWSPEEYEAKAESCYKEARYYADKAERCDNLDDKRHNLNEAKKWQERGDEYMKKAEYARK